MAKIDDEARLELWCYANPDKAAAEIERLRAALDRYALHDTDCQAEAWHGKGPMRCSCGFYEATEPTQS